MDDTQAQLNKPSEFWELLRERAAATVLQLLSLLLDTLLVVGWLFLLHLARLAFDYVARMFSSASSIDSTEHWIIETGHHLFSVAAMATALLYIGTDFAKIAVRKVREIHKEWRGTHEQGSEHHEK